MNLLKVPLFKAAYNQLIIVFILLILPAIISSTLFAQTQNSNEWSLLKSESGIEVYSQRITCEIEGTPNPFDYIVFKVVNSTSETVNANLQFEIYFEEGCNGCEGHEETSRNINLNAGESIEASCSNFEGGLSYFILNPSFTESWTYTHSKVIIQLIK